MMGQVNKILNTVAEIISDAPQIFLDYDGTMVPIIKDPEKNQADHNLRVLIDNLNSRFETYIVTGREVGDIVAFLGEYNVVGLHGSVLHIGGSTINIPGFYKYIELFNRIYADNLYLEKKFPGLGIYNKTGSILFHLGKISRVQTLPAIYKIVGSIAERYKLSLYSGIDIIELRIPCINKGIAIQSIRNSNRPAIIIGDDVTDEDSFILNPDAITIKVGDGATNAKFRLKYPCVRPLLWKIVDLLQ
jgi:trehalose-phosphatase